MFTGVTNVGEATVLDLLLQGATEPRLRLFKNDYTPDETTALGDLTESTFPGYAPIDAETASAPVTQPDGQTLRTVVGASFVRSAGSGSENAYGWYLTLKPDGITPIVYAAKRFDAPRLLQVDGDKVEFDLDVIATDLGS